MITDILEGDKCEAEHEHETEISCYVQDLGPALDAPTPIPYPTIACLQEIQAVMLAAGISPSSLNLTPSIN